tara:strand:- start:376 stop:681 length:306 start_codon:yes stop_codon:yes gene_type:complete
MCSSIQYEVKINKWLNKNIENNNGQLLYENELFTNNKIQNSLTTNDKFDEPLYELYLYSNYVEYFLNSLLDNVDKNMYEIYNINQFRDELTKFIYKYSHDK